MTQSCWGCVGLWKGIWAPPGQNILCRCPAECSLAVSSHSKNKHFLKINLCSPGFLLSFVFFLCLFSFSLSFCSPIQQSSHLHFVEIQYSKNPLSSLPAHKENYRTLKFTFQNHQYENKAFWSLACVLQWFTKPLFHPHNHQQTVQGVNHRIDLDEEKAAFPCQNYSRKNLELIFNWKTNEMVQRLQDTHRQVMDNYHSSTKFNIIKPFPCCHFRSGVPPSLSLPKKTSNIGTKGMRNL